MAEMLIGYARCSTDEQDLTVQRDALAALGVSSKRIYVDYGLTERPVPVRDCVRPWPRAAPGTPWW